jgi:hypothetical protein
MLVSLPDFRSEMADSREALGSMCLAIRRLSKGVYHFSLPCKLPLLFLDRVREGRLHLLIRKGLRMRPVEGCLPERAACVCAVRDETAQVR